MGMSQLPNPGVLELMSRSCAAAWGLWQILQERPFPALFTWTACRLRSPFLKLVAFSVVAAVTSCGSWQEKQSGKASVPKGR